MTDKIFYIIATSVAEIYQPKNKKYNALGQLFLKAETPGYLWMIQTTFAEHSDRINCRASDWKTFLPQSSAPFVKFVAAKQVGNLVPKKKKKKK